MARQQLAKAGYRLAKLLDAIFERKQWAVGSKQEAKGSACPTVRECFIPNCPLDCSPPTAHYFLTMNKINLEQKLSLINDHWNPRIIGELNGQYLNS